LDWDFAKLVVIHLLSLHPLAAPLSSDAIGRDLATESKSEKARKIRYLQQHKPHQAREQTKRGREGREQGKCYKLHLILYTLQPSLDRDQPEDLTNVFLVTHQSPII